jgi:hypothetical protein
LPGRSRKDPVKLHPVPVFQGRGGPDHDRGKGRKAAYPGKEFLQNGLFFVELAFIGEVLQGTAPADPVEGAGREGSLGRGLQDFH